MKKDETKFLRHLNLALKLNQTESMRDRYLRCSIVRETLFDCGWQVDDAGGGIALKSFVNSDGETKTVGVYIDQYTPKLHALCLFGIKNIAKDIQILLPCRVNKDLFHLVKKFDEKINVMIQGLTTNHNHGNNSPEAEISPNQPVF
jgi:hypothetical protein